LLATGVVATSVKFTDTLEDLDALEEAVVFMNASKDSLRVGLGISEERGLEEDVKLEIFDYADFLRSTGPGSMSEKRVETDFLGTPHTLQIWV
jgi:hypothetical protein